MRLPEMERFSAEERDTWREYFGGDAFLAENPVPRASRKMYAMRCSKCAHLVGKGWLHIGWHEGLSAEVQQDLMVQRDRILGTVRQK